MKERFNIIYNYEKDKNVEHINLVDTYDHTTIMTAIINLLETPRIIVRAGALEFHERAVMRNMMNILNDENDLYTQTILRYCND